MGGTGRQQRSRQRIGAMQCAVLGPFCRGAAQLEIEREILNFPRKNLLKRLIGKNRRDSGYGVLLLVGSCFDDLLENHKDEEVKHKSDKKYVPEFETDNHRTFKLIAAIARIFCLLSKLQVFSDSAKISVRDNTNPRSNPHFFNDL